jgi:hypothetical protein
MYGDTTLGIDRSLSNALYRNPPIFTVATPPVQLPVLLADVKRQLRLVGSDEVTIQQLIAPGVYPDAVKTIDSATVSLEYYRGILTLDAGECTGTLSIKIYHRNSSTEDWLEWKDTDGEPVTFSDVDSDNDNQSYVLEYTGGKRYIMLSATVADDDCAFGISISLNTPETADDAWLTETINSLVEVVQDKRNICCITQKLDMTIDTWPREPMTTAHYYKEYIEIPRWPVQSVESIHYIDTANVSYEFTNTNWYLDKNKFIPLVALHYGKIWPMTTLRPTGAVTVSLTAGYTSPAEFKKNESLAYQWILSAVNRLYYDRSLTIEDISQKALNYKSHKLL